MKTNLVYQGMQALKSRNIINGAKGFRQRLEAALALYASAADADGMP